ncbi:uncharacterized protein [Miscanthus floridulus]|uniref:uncharacterized protein isoform X2 n=1 Tax=Miscanthus floridulus TaxID=154761 RepID=UPI00345913B4
MDRLQRRNPSSRTHSTSLKPPRPPRGPTFQPPPASRPLREPEPEPSSPVCDAKTAEYKFFKKLCEQSGHSSRSYKHSHQSFESKDSKQKQGSCNVTAPKKFYVHENTVYCDDPPATPAKNEEIPGEKISVQSSHSEYGDKDTPQVSPHDCLLGIHVLTPIAQTSFDVTGISGNVDREPVSGQIFSEKRSKLLKIAAKAVSMGSAELFQRRSEFVRDILQRLGTDNIMRKQEGSMRHRKMDCRQALAIPKGHFDNLLDYKRSEFNSLAKLRRTGKMSSSYASDEECEFMALPWGYNQGPVDRKNDLSHGGSEARECVALPWVCVNNTLSSNRKGDIDHNQVSNSLLEDVNPYVHGRCAFANELSLNVQTDSYDQHGWDPMLSVTLSKPFRDRLYFPCQNEEQHAVPFGILNTSGQPDLCSSIEQYTSSSVGLCGNSGAGFSTRLAQLVVKPTISSILECGSDILDHNDFRCISNFHVSQSNNMLSSNSSCLNSMSTPEQSYRVGAKSLLDSSFGLSCLAGLEQYSTEVELPDNSDRLLQVLDQLPVKFIPSSFSNDNSRIWDHQSSYAEPACKQDWGSLHDSSTELWSSGHQLQSHADSGAVLGFMPNGSAYSNLVERHHSLMLAQGNLNNDILGTTDVSFFGSCLALDNITEAPMLSSNGITW